MTGLVAVGAIVTAARIPFSSDALRRRVVATLEDRLNAQVDLADINLRFYPTIRVVGTGLEIHHRGRRDVPPLIAVSTFTMNTDFVSLWRRHVNLVRLDGLKIHIPPGGVNGGQVPTEGDPTAVDTRVPPEIPVPPDDPNSYVRQIVLDRLEAPDAELVILRRDPNKPTRTWALHQLHVQSIGMNREMPFQTVLTNGIPPGQIVSSGSFGPWRKDDPGQTPLHGAFTFDNADLSVFKGIAGTLSAKGSYGGTLDRIGVDGQTETPDFAITFSGHPVPLTTTYHAVVDATNGNTTLDPVNAKFLNTSLVARGGVYEVPNVKGRVVRLEIEMESGKLEDLMRLAVNTPQPTMTGTLHLKTGFELPPGKADVVEKLRLNGRFNIERGRFTNAAVQTKIEDLSQRASAKMSEERAPNVTSNFAGRFQLANGRLSLPDVIFDIPGALVQLKGDYALREQTLAFDGNLFMDAKVSQTVTGFKSLLLKLADPIFRKNGRTVIPLQITGTRSEPKFGVDVGRVFRPGAAPVAPPSRGLRPLPAPAPSSRPGAGPTAQ